MYKNILTARFLKRGVGVYVYMCVCVCLNMCGRACACADTFYGWGSAFVPPCLFLPAYSASAPVAGPVGASPARRWAIFITDSHAT